MSLKFSCDGVKEVLVLSLLSVVWNNDIILWLRRPAAVSKKKSAPNCKNGILLPKLFWPTVRKNCSSDRENENFWDHLNNLFKQWKVRTISGNRMLF